MWEIKGKMASKFPHTRNDRLFISNINRETTLKMTSYLTFILLMFRVNKFDECVTSIHVMQFNVMILHNSTSHDYMR